MSPGKDDSAPRLRVVPGGLDSIAPSGGSEPPSNASAVSSRPPEAPISIPPRYADPAQLEALLRGETATPYEHTLMALGELANPHPGGGYDVTFPFRNTAYRLLQQAPGLPIQLTVTQPRPGGPAQLFALTYLPDGQVESSVQPTPHAAPQKGETTHHQILQRSILQERAQRILQGRDLYVRLRTSLEALKGRYTPETQSAWYDDFVFHDGDAYSFRLLNLFGLQGMESNPQTSQISVYEQSANQRIKLLTLSATGENNWEPSRPDRQPLTPQLFDRLRKLTELIETARVDPQAYQRDLHVALKRGAGQRAIDLPEISYSVEIPRTLGSGFGLRGEPILEIRSGLDLLRNFHPWATHRWQNPDDPADVRHLAPPWRLSWHMSRELSRWIGETSSRAAFGSLADPRVQSDLLRLQLFPEGGGQVFLYRKGELHDILIAEAEGPVWRAGREIAHLEKSGTVFENRLVALQMAVAARGTRKALPDSFPIQEAPLIDLDRIHLDSGGSPTAKISSAMGAWRRIQLQIPEGVNPRVQSIDGSLLTPDIDHIHVDFRSHPLLQFEIRHQDISARDDAPIRRVEVIMLCGEDTYARVYEDGLLRPDAARNVHRKLLTRAQEGNVPVSRWAAGAQFLPRIYGYYKTSGGTYALSYFGALPFTLGFEHLYLTKGERELVGTPMPHLDSLKSFLHYFVHDFSIPFMTLSTVSGVTGLLTDGVFNLAPGIVATLRMKDATFGQAWRLSKPSFYNEYPHVRPIGRNFFRSFLQRSLPLFTGAVALQKLYHGDINLKQLEDTAIGVGAVSTVSNMLVNGAYRSAFLSDWMLRHNWIENTLLNGAATAEGRVAAQTASRLTLAQMSRRARYALTFRGGVWVAILETIALGIWMGVKKGDWVDAMENELRSQVGNALDRRNELITRLEHGEEVSPGTLASADHGLQLAQGAYRRILELRERRKGSGNFAALGLNNDFADAYQFLDRQALLRGDSFTERMSAEQRLQELRERGDRTEREQHDLYTRYGMAAEAPEEKAEGLREFLSRLAADKTLQSQAPSPVSVDSPEGEAIREQLRWKTAHDPAFASWSPEEKARYLLREFRAYRVREADGSSRPWRLGEALGFLAADASAEAGRGPSPEEAAAPPSSKPKELDASRLEDLLKEERDRIVRETAERRHAQVHAQVLARNVTDFDAQMAAYYHASNERMAGALEAFLNQS